MTHTTEMSMRVYDDTDGTFIEVKEDPDGLEMIVLKQDDREIWLVNDKQIDAVVRCLRAVQRHVRERKAMESKP